MAIDERGVRSLSWTGRKENQVGTGTARAHLDVFSISAVFSRDCPNMALSHGSDQVIHSPLGKPGSIRFT